jgi:hypothetical protein
MSTYPRTPRVQRGGLVLIDLYTSRIERVVVLQYNPDTMTRTLQVQGASGEAADHLEALRLKGPPIETIKLDVEIDATDKLEHPDAKENRAAVTHGILPELAALETVVYPPSSQVQANSRQAAAGVMEILPLAAPLQIFVFGKHRALPVRVTEMTVTEEAFSAELAPIRAKVSLGLRVLGVNDLQFDNRGGSLFMTYYQQKERLALAQSGAITSLGLSGLP